jgi:hypothetical protein
VPQTFDLGRLARDLGAELLQTLALLGDDALELLDLGENGGQTRLLRRLGRWSRLGSRHRTRAEQCHDQDRPDRRRDERAHDRRL